jgi:tetratricopeptide (TPR) repeat protein
MSQTRSRNLSLLTFLIISWALSPAFGQQNRHLPTGVEINGQVRYSEGGGPADKALVRLEKFNGGLVGQTMTDRTGKFNFSGMAPAIYIVTVRMQGYKEIQQQVDLQTTPRSYQQYQLIPEKIGDEVSPAPAEMVDATIPAEAQKEYETGRAELLEHKKIDSGIGHLEKAIKVYPGYTAAHLLLATALVDRQQYERAERELRRVLEIDPQSSSALFTLGEIYRRQKKYDEAEKTLQDGLKLEPGSPQGHLNLGRVYYDQGDITKAGPEVGRALKLKPDFAEAYLLAGNLFLRARRVEDALKMYEQYLRLEPKGQFAAQTREQVNKIKKALGEKNKS